MLENQQITPQKAQEFEGNSVNIETFGEYLRGVRMARGISLRFLAKAVNRTPTYLSDIENGFNRPPDHELLDKLADALHLAEEPTALHRFYDLAAIGRGDLPADIKSFIHENPDVIHVLRKIKNAPNGDTIHRQIVTQVWSVLP